MSRWFRFYDEALDDPKVQMLRPELFKAWVNLLCLASKREGVLPSDEEIAFALRVSTKDASGFLNELVDRGLIDDDNESTRPHNWNSRQFKSDTKDATNNERQRRHRANQRNGRVTDDRNGDVTEDAVTPKRPETETEQIQNTHSSAREPTAAENYGQAINETYARAGKATPDLNPSIRWRKAGWPIEIVCEVIRAKLSANPSKNFPLTYFENPISEAVARQNAPVPIAVANQRAGPSAKPPSLATQILQANRQNESFSNVPSRQTNTRLIDASPIASEPR